MGLPQYRKKLMHHCIDGRLLIRLTDDLLKTEIGIGPLVSLSSAAFIVSCSHVMGIADLMKWLWTVRSMQAQQLQHVATVLARKQTCQAGMHMEGACRLKWLPTQGKHAPIITISHLKH